MRAVRVQSKRINGMSLPGIPGRSRASGVSPLTPFLPSSPADPGKPYTLHTMTQQVIIRTLFIYTWRSDVKKSRFD